MPRCRVTQTDRNEPRTRVAFTFNSTTSERLKITLSYQRKQKHFCSEPRDKMKITVGMNNLRPKQLRVNTEPRHNFFIAPPPLIRFITPPLKFRNDLFSLHRCCLPSAAITPLYGPIKAKTEVTNPPLARRNRNQKTIMNGTRYF